MHLAVVCIGFLGLLVFGLGLRVSLLRQATQTSIGYDSDPSNTLHKWVRAHANACEFAPMLAILIFAIASGGDSRWDHFLYVAAVIVRYLHAAGMVLTPTLAAPHPLRFAGALGTYVVGLLLALAAIL
jgi:uncharacterized protein